MSNLDELRKVKARLDKKEKQDTVQSSPDGDEKLKCMVPDKIIELIKEGRPCLIMVDDGQNTAMIMQRLARPSAIGLLNIMLKKQLDAEEVQNNAF